MEMAGYPPLVPAGHDKLDVIQLINASYDLMNQVKQWQVSDKESDDRSYKVLTDLQHCQVSAPPPPELLRSNEDISRNIINIFLMALALALALLLAVAVVAPEGVVRQTRA